MLSSVAEHNAVHAYRPCDVLDLLLAHVFEGKREFVAHLVSHRPTYADATGLGQGLKSCRDIHAVAVDITAVPDDVADIDPHAEIDPAITRHIGISLGHLALHFDRATYRVDNAGELEEQAVSRRFHYTAAMFLYLWIGEIAPKRLQCREGALLQAETMRRPLSGGRSPGQVRR